MHSQANSSLSFINLAKLSYIHFCITIMLVSMIICGCAAQESNAPNATEIKYSDSESAFGESNLLADEDSQQMALPPELEEATFQLLAPQTGRDFMFVAHESLNTVSKIDVDSLAVESIPVCDRPTQIKAIKEMNLAVVLCQGSDEVEVIQLTTKASGGYTIHTRRVRIPQRMNRLSLSPNGAIVFMYHKEDEEDPLGSVQMVAAIRVDTPLDTPLNVMQLSVGFKVKEITYRGEQEDLRGFIISENAVSPFRINQIRESAILPRVPAGISTEFGEILISESGRYIISRGWESQAVNITRISDLAVKVIGLSAPPTDIDNVPYTLSDASDADLSLEESMDQLLVMVRDAQDVLLVSLDDLLDTNDVDLAEWRLELQDGVHGLATVSHNGRWALLYTSLAEVDDLTLVDLTGQIETKIIHLRKGIQGIKVSQDNNYALVTHSPQSVTDLMSAADQFIAQSPAYSIVHLETGYSRLIPTQSEVKSSAFWSASSDSEAFAFLIFNDESRVDRVDLGDLSVETRHLGSLAVDVGQVTARGKIWINQEHPLGRISFWDILSGELLTLTGFELNRRVQ